MSQPQPPLDEQGEAREALNSAVTNYGPRILENPQILGNVFTDLLPDLPRERSLLMVAAEAGVATDLRQHVRNQNLDPGTAVQLVARRLADKKAIDPAASMWVTTIYARALGYAVPVSVPPSGLGRPLAQPAVSVPSGLGPTLAQAPVSVPSSGPMSAPPFGSPSAPPYGGGPSAPPYGGVPSAPPYGGVPSAPPSGGEWYSPTGGPRPGPGGPTGSGGPPTRPDSGKRRNRAMMAAAAVVAGVLVIYVIAAAATHLFPFPAHKTGVTPTPTVTSTPAKSHGPTTPPSPTLAPGVANLAQLLPGDLDQTAVECPAQKPPYEWAMPGLVEALQCSDPSLPGGTIVAYQMDTSAHFQQAWQNFDTWWGFDITTAQGACPPSGSDGQGTISWHSQDFPNTNGQSLECSWVGSNNDRPAYVWAFPTENAFILAEGAPGSSFSALDSWWSQNAAPAAAPTPAISATSSP